MWGQANQREADAATILPTPVNREVNESMKPLENASLEPEPQSSLPRKLDEEPARYPIDISSEANVQPSFPPDSAIISQAALQTDAEQGQKETPATEKVLKRAREEPRDAIRLVIVEKADTLEKIILQQYGTVNLKLLIAVLTSEPRDSKSR